ncbi:MAG: bifunctional nuclease family protein [Puniceicoccales bacterium]|jgi:bifunctional DNase/RNase|nr:bifunctional nuclease family protein [Puniceicoccales bacterium]
MPESVSLLIKGVMPVENGTAIFLGNEEKTFVIYTSSRVGSMLANASRHKREKRPETHELLGDVLTGLGVNLDQVIIHAVKNKVFYAKLVLNMRNELGTKVVVIDARPSDALLLAVRFMRPILATRDLFDSLEDMSDVMRKIWSKSET